MPSDPAISSLIDQLAAPAAEADAAGSKLIALGPAVVAVLVDRFPNAPTPVRRRLAYLLGRYDLANSDAARRITTLVSAVADGDWKVRRNAAVSLGTLRAAAATEALLGRVAVEDDDRVRPSLLLALGRTASPEQLDRLRTLQLSTPRDREAAAKMIDSVSARSDSKIGVRGNVAPGLGPARCELWTRSGVASIAAVEAKAAGIEAEPIAPDRVQVGASATLNQLGTIRAALFPVVALWTDTPAGEPVALGKAVADGLRPALEALTDGNVSYRITLDGASTVVGQRATWIRAFASAADNLVNRATSYTWELRVRADNTGTLVGARPAALEDTRFSYRRADVPAALHPSLAAAAVRLATPLRNDVVVDPCCGSGTLLAERAVAGPYRALHGFDRDGRAISAARRNLAGREQIRLVRTDLAALDEVDRPTLVITNPPYGRRVSDNRSARTLHQRLDAVVADRLAPGGRFVVFRPPGFETPRGLQIERSIRVDAGGIPVDLLLAIRAR